MSNNKSPIEMINDKHCDEEQLVRAIENLGVVNEAPEFWTNIVENKAYRKNHRRHSVYQFFYRHVKPGMTLSQLAQILGSPTWLANEDISIVEDLGGYIPVKVTFDNTVLVLDILPDPDPVSEHWYVYVSVTGHVDPKNFYQLLQGGAVDQATSEATILEIGFSPPVIDSLKIG